ncbi:MAG: enoyl-CoA hydratase/isomerase family protein [Gammaproteobacteria bacterium]
MSDTILYETSGAVATILLNRPEAVNGFTGEMRQALIEATREARDDAAIRAVVLSGSGRGFSAGADLKAGFKSGADVRRVLNEEYGPSLHNIVQMEKPVIAAINGFAAGIGMSYALACDLAVMGEKAFLLCPFSNIGLVPDGGSTWLLSNGLGYRRAYEMAIENDRLPASAALAAGLVNKVVADDEVLQTAHEWATKLSAKAPLALGRTKKLMRQAPMINYLDAIAAEAELQGLCIDSNDSKEGIAAFLEKRQAEFKGD